MNYLEKDNYRVVACMAIVWGSHLKDIATDIG